MKSIEEVEHNGEICFYEKLRTLNLFVNDEDIMSEEVDSTVSYDELKSVYIVEGLTDFYFKKVLSVSLRFFAYI